jgi:hypothetical protein
VPAPPAPAPFRRVLRRRAVRVLRPVLYPLVRRLRGGSQDRSRPGVPKLRRPVARVLARPDGTLVIRLQAKKLPKGESALQLRARGSESAGPVRVPLPPRSEAVDGWVEVRLDRAAHRLREARWDTYVVRSLDGSRKRIRADRVETARLLSAPAPTDSEGALNPWVPYTTTDGYLAVRAWHRRNHAEVLSVELGPESCTVRARLYGPVAHPGAVREGRVLAVPRRETERRFELPVQAPQSAQWAESADPSGSARPAKSTESAGSSRSHDESLVFELPYELPGALDSGDSKGVWDLWFCPSGEGDGERVRFARLLGDLADRKKTDVLPQLRLGDSEIGLRLYFSVSNDLVLSLQPLPSGTPARIAAPLSAAPSAGAPASAPTAASPSAHVSASASSGPASGGTAQTPSSSPSASASS